MTPPPDALPCPGNYFLATPLSTSASKFKEGAGTRFTSMKHRSTDSLVPAVLRKVQEGE